MVDRLVLDHRRWLGSSAEELGYGDLSVRTSISRQRTTSGQAFNVVVADGRQSDQDPTIFSSTPYDYRIDPLLVRKVSILAKQTTARIVQSEVPGITIDHDNPFIHLKSDRQTVAQTLAALRGNFDQHATLQLEAMDKAIGSDLPDGSRVGILGESLGAHAAVSMGRILASGQFSRRWIVPWMGLIDPVNTYGDQSLTKQVSTIRNLVTIENPRVAQYLAENTLIGHGEFGSFRPTAQEDLRMHQLAKRRQQLSMQMVGVGLRWGLHRGIAASLRDQSDDGIGLHAGEIAIFHAAASTVSPRADAISLAQSIRHMGGNAHVFSLDTALDDDTPAGHHMLNSLARLAEFGCFLDKDDAFRLALRKQPSATPQYADLEAKAIERSLAS